MALSWLMPLLLGLATQDPKPADPKPGPPMAEAPKADALKTEDVPIDVYWNNGLRFRTKDPSVFEARIGGRLLVHYRNVFDRPDDDTTANGLRTVPNGFFVRQARLEMEGTFLKEFGFKAQADFGTGLYNQSTGTGPSNVSGTLRDAFLEWKKYSAFQVRLGQYLLPVSQEDTSSSRFIDFAERSVVSRFQPGRDIGLQVAGVLFEKHLDYAVCATNGNALLNDQGRAVSDADDGKEVAGWLRFHPFIGSDSDFLKGLRLGIGASVVSVDDVASGNFDLTTPELSVLYLESSLTPAIRFDGRRTRIDPQISWAIGSFGLRAEYLIRTDELSDNATEDSITTKGFYVQGTFLVTGENKAVETRVIPKNDFGAVEFALRFARVKIDDVFDSGIATPVGNTDQVTAVTVGVNWWITRYVRITANVIVEKYADEIQFDRREEDSLTGFLFRGQIDF